MARTSLGAVLVLGLLVLASCSGSDDGPRAAVQQFYLHLNEGDYADAMALYNTEALGVLEDPATAGEHGFADWAAQETHGGNVGKVKIVAERREGEGVTVDFDVVYRDGTTRRHTVPLTFEDGRWKLGLIG